MGVGIAWTCAFMAVIDCGSGNCVGVWSCPPPRCRLFGKPLLLLLLLLPLLPFPLLPLLSLFRLLLLCWPFSWRRFVFCSLPGKSSGGVLCWRNSLKTMIARTRSIIGRCSIFPLLISSLRRAFVKKDFDWHVTAQST